MKYLYVLIAIFALLIGSLFIYKTYFNKNTEVKINSTKSSNKKEVTNTTSNTSSKKEYKIVAFGDSLTAGYGVELRDSYPSILEAALNKQFSDKNVSIKVINTGVSGETTSGGVERIDFVISQNPNLVLLGLGANDMLRATDPSLTKTNLDKIIKSFKDKNIPVVILGMQSQVSNGINYKINFDSIYTDLSKKHDMLLVPFFLEGVAMVSSLNISDGIHPNRAGYEKIINENILPILLPFLDDVLN